MGLRKEGLAMPKLTKSFVDGLVSDETKDKLVFDSELRGFGARISRAGVRSWIAQGRVGGSGGHTPGHPIRMTIGSPGQASQGFAILGALLAYAGRQHKRED